MLSSTLAHLQKVMQTKIYQLGHLLPVWSNAKLLAWGRQQAVLQEIQQLSALPEAHFKALYRSAINYYAEFVQVIPEQPQSALGGLLNLGLARGLLALRQFASEPDSKLDADPLINYAIFTAGLFFDTAKVISQQRIVICDGQGNYLQDWYPYSASLVEQGAEFYKIYFYNTTAYQALNHEAAALLARQLMPREGFIWLSSELELFIDWLDTLRGEQSQGGRRISRCLSLIRQEDLLAMIKNLQQSTIDSIIPKEMPLQDQFYIWLCTGLADGSIALNTKDAYVHLLDDGTLYLNNEIFKRFLESKNITTEVSKLARDFSEEFALSSQAAQERTSHTGTFLTQRWEQKTLQVRNGILAFASLFIMDTTGIPVSPLLKDIKSGLVPSRQLPAGIKQVLGVDRGPEQGPSPRMR